MTKEQAQKIVSDFLLGVYELAQDFEFIENKEIYEYSIHQEIKGIVDVFLTFPAKKDYQKVKIEDNLLVLEGFLDKDLEDLYDYANPIYITVDGDKFEIRHGFII